MDGESKAVKSETPIDQSKFNGMLCVLADISSMCVGEIAMGYKLDAQAIGEMIYEATGMTSPELTEHVKGLAKANA